MTALNKMDKSWTLFLDRDGVINHEIEGAYINNWNEFVFYKNVPEVFKTFSRYFGRIIVVTNQRGVSKGLTKIEDLLEIHTNLKAAVIKAGGNIDAIFFCTDEDDNSPNRKPNTGMALQALAQFPDIAFNKSIIVGDKLSDMNFGRNLGMHTVFLSTTHKEVNQADKNIDRVFDSLDGFARALEADKLSLNL
jgi:histidinol-phosphate phosphatase family protein